MFNNKTPILGLEYDMMMQRYFKQLEEEAKKKAQSARI